MRLLSRLVCALVGHRPDGGRATYDTSAGSFVDVARTQYAVCTRCGAVRPAPLTVVDGEDHGEADDDEADGGEVDETTRTSTGESRGEGASESAEKNDVREDGEEPNPDGAHDPAVTDAR